MKKCMHCFENINDLAGVCPYCRSEGQGTYGRIILTVAGIVIFVLSVNYFL